MNIPVHNLPKNSPNVIQQYLQKTREAYEDPEVVEAYWNRSKTKPNTQNLDRMVELLGVGASVLDLGCGPGRDSSYLALKGLEVVGVDYSTQMIAKAKELHDNISHLVFKTMDMNNLTFEKESFDGVWASASLLHIPKRGLPHVFMEIYRVLNKGGTLFVSVMKGVGEKFTVETKYAKPIERFFTFFSLKEIQSYLKKAGFNLFEMNTNPSTSRQSTIWLNIFSRKVSYAKATEDQR